MSNQNEKQPVDQEKILDNVRENHRTWTPTHESFDYGRKTNDSIVSNTFKPPQPDGGDDKKKE